MVGSENEWKKQACSIHFLIPTLILSEHDLPLYELLCDLCASNDPEQGEGEWAVK
jgi:hypothetical protein